MALSFGDHHLHPSQNLNKFKYKEFSVANSWSLFRSADLPALPMRKEIQMKRYRVVWVALALLCLASTVQAQVTSLSLVSDTGDFVGLGQTTFLTPADGTFNAQGISTGNHVGVFFLGNQPGIFWSLDFAAPNGQTLAVGTYPGATRWPFEAPNQPGLSVFGDGRGCNTLTGSFAVLEISYGADGNIASFDATFEQH